MASSKRTKVVKPVDSDSFDSDEDEDVFDLPLGRFGGVSQQPSPANLDLFRCVGGRSCCQCFVVAFLWLLV